MEDQVGEHGLLEGRLEGLDQLVGQLLDEADGVGQQVVAAGELEAAGGRVEGVEEPVPHPDLGAGQRVQQRRLAGVGVAGEGDPRQRGALAPGAHHAAVALEPAEPAAQGRDPVAGEAAVGLDLALARAPGADAAVHAPAPRRSRWVQSPRMRAMLYSSWASSTCSLPSAEWAWSAKMSRITAVRSITGTPERRLEVALLARRQLVVAGDQVGVAGGDLLLSARPACRGRSSGRGRAAARCWTASPAVATPAVRSSSFSSASGSPVLAAVDDADRQRPLAGPRVRDAGAVRDAA